MKKIINSANLYPYFCLLVILVTSCNGKSDFNIISSADKTKPGVVTNVKVVNVPGGANISYELPSSPNILYVQATYKINDQNVVLTKKASYLMDTMSLRGFQKSQDYTVTLRVVTQANVSSDSLVVPVHPGTPPYLTAAQHVSMVPDFGGTYITSVNTDTSQSVRYVVLLQDSSTNSLTTFYQAYTHDSLIKYNVRGLPSKPTKFGVYFTDEYGNASDTTFTTLTPITEEKMDKSLFRNYPLPSDNNNGALLYGWWPVQQLWDEKYAGNDGAYCWRGTSIRTPNPWPITASFDMGKPAKLSRFIYWPRLDNYSWDGENAKHFSLWGSNVTNPADAELPSQSNMGDVIGDWVNLGNFEPLPKPSGLPGVNTAVDNAFATAGWEYILSSSNPVVRYIRLEVEDNYNGNTAVIVTELTFYGNPQ